MGYSIIRTMLQHLFSDEELLACYHVVMNMIVRLIESIVQPFIFFLFNVFDGYNTYARS